MNKQQLIKAMATSAGITQVAARAALQSFQDNVMFALSDGEDVVLVNFGTFKASQQPERTARNPATGEAVKALPKSA